MDTGKKVDTIRVFSILENKRLNDQGPKAFSEHRFEITSPLRIEYDERNLINELWFTLSGYYFQGLPYEKPDSNALSDNCRVSWNYGGKLGSVRRMANKSRKQLIQLF